MNIEYCLGNALVALAEDRVSFLENLEGRNKADRYDLDLLYVECRNCGKPVLWGKGKTRLLVNASGMDVTVLDEECMILSDGCPGCRPATTLFHLQVVRVAALSPQDVLLLADSRGNA